MRLSFTAAALKAYDKQAKEGSGKPKQALAKSGKLTISTATQPTSAKAASQKRVLSERSGTQQQPHLKRFKTDTVVVSPLHSSADAAAITSIADELETMFEDEGKPNQ
jgi:hypothetical protein